MKFDTIKLGIVMDPIEHINTKKDSSIAMIIEAQKRGYIVYYMELHDLYLRKNESRAYAKKINIDLKKKIWFKLNHTEDIILSHLDVILMRKDPPVDIDFIYATYILENAEKKGTLVINKPQSLRDFNEKMSILYFPKLIADTLVTSKKTKIINFLDKYNDIIIKPLNGMGGKSVFRIKENDGNKHVIIENLTNNENTYCMVQQYLPDIKYGDKRIIIIDGIPMPYILTRFSHYGEYRNNLAAGGKGVTKKISSQDYDIAKKIGFFLKQKGLIFVGLDIIGKKITEINITSPTCIREIEHDSSISITNIFMNTIENFLIKK